VKQEYTTQRYDNLGNTRNRKMTNKYTQPRDTDNIGTARHRKMKNKNT
jgi:hypothetical protein